MNQSLIPVLVNDQMAKAAEQEEDSKKKIVALEKEIARVQEEKVTVSLRKIEANLIDKQDHVVLNIPWMPHHILMLSSDFLLLFQIALKTMTVDEYFARNPQVKEKIDDEIRNNLWGY
jgi:hypothetical protein